MSSLEQFLRKLHCTKTEEQLETLIKKLAAAGVQSLSELNRLTEKEWQALDLRDDVKTRIDTGLQKVKEAKRAKAQQAVISHPFFSDVGSAEEPPASKSSPETKTKSSRRTVRNILLDADMQKEFVAFLTDLPGGVLENDEDITDSASLVARIHLWNDCQKYEENETLYLANAHFMWYGRCLTFRQKYLDENPHEQTGISQELIDYVRSILWSDADGADHRGLLGRKTFRLLRYPSPYCRAWVEESLRSASLTFSGTPSTPLLRKKSSVLRKRSAKS